MGCRARLQGCAIVPRLPCCYVALESSFKSLNLCFSVCLLCSGAQTQKDSIKEFFEKELRGTSSLTASPIKLSAFDIMCLLPSVGCFPPCCQTSHSCLVCTTLPRMTHTPFL